MILIGGFIGYITNKVAIKMLFRPVNPIKIGFIVFQGVFPKRKDKMAVSLADTIEKELLSKEVVVDQLFNEENKKRLLEIVKTQLASQLANKIPPMVKMFVGNDLDKTIEDFIDKNGEEWINQLIEKIKEDGLDNFSIHEIVKNRIDHLDFVEFEKIVFGLMNKELRFVEIIGLFLGMIIGLLQYFVGYFL
jgi:uncharacterized membrane protein YheB (UPF0754 family)